MARRTSTLDHRAVWSARSSPRQSRRISPRCLSTRRLRSRRESPAARVSYPVSRVPCPECQIENLPRPCKIDRPIGLDRVDRKRLVESNAQKLAERVTWQLRVDAEREMWCEGKPGRLVLNAAQLHALVQRADRTIGIDRHHDDLSLIHISEPTRLLSTSYAV